MATLSGIITPTNVLTATSTATLTNKTINAANNTVTNVPLSTGVTGTLPIANGGTGSTSTTFANLTTNVTGTLPVANGGTGAATLTTNNVLLGNGTSALQVVAPGTTGNVLTSNGTTWTSAAGSPAGWTLLSTVTASSSATADVETTFNSTYDEYAILCTSVVAPSNGVSFLCRLKIGGTYQTNSYQYHLHNSNSGGTTYIAQASSGTDSSIILAVNIGNTTGMSGDFTISISNPTSTSLTSLVRSSGAFMHSSGAIRLATGAGCRTASQAALTGVRFLFDSGNIISGTFRLYGIRK
jgi:hypothetical protein